MRRVETGELEYLDDDRAYIDGMPFTGLVFETNRRGIVIAETEYRDGLEDGPWTEWFSDGTTKRSTGENRAGRAIGTYRVWHGNGRLAEETTYDDAGTTRTRRTWDDEGNQLSDKTYR